MSSSRDPNSVARYFKTLRRSGPSPLESTGGGMLEAMVDAVGEDLESLGIESTHALEGLELAARGQDIDDTQAGALEAIIHREERPAIDIHSDRYDTSNLPGAWAGPLAEHFTKVQPCIPSIGRVRSDRPYARYDGTGFLVGERLVMTNRHVAEKFANGIGRAAGAEPFPAVHAASVEPRVEPGGPKPDDPLPWKVRGVRMVHPYWDMALLELEEAPPDREPLRLRAAPLSDEELAKRQVAVIGYPYFDERNDDFKLQNQIFRGQWGVKRLLPGWADAPFATGSYGRMLRAMTHDASTLGGNSGSAVIDLATGEVLGLHFGGFYLQRNFAVPAWELARDVQVRKVIVSFSSQDWLEPDPNAEEVWARYLEPAEEVEAPAAASTVAAAPALTEGGLPRDFLLHMDEEQLTRAAIEQPELVRARLEAVLGPEEAEETMADLLGGATEAPTPIDPELPEIIWLHGIMGGHLSLVRRRPQHLWINAWSMATSNVAELLKLGPDGSTDVVRNGIVQPSGLIQLFYGKATRKWRQAGFAVHEFSYDWRRGIAQLADRLHLFVEGLRVDRPGRRFALVGHSMGGLVASMYAARHPTWADAIQRAVFLGSPLGGAFTPIEAIAGTHPLMQKMAIIVRGDAGDFAQLSRTLPGLLDMLPDPVLFPEVERVYRASEWAEPVRPAQRWLDQSRGVKALVRSSPLLEVATLLLSLGHPTVGALADGGVIGPARATAAGDGTVPGRSLWVDGVPAFHLSREHSQLPLEGDAIDAVDALLRSGVCGLRPVDKAETQASVAPPESVQGIAEADYDAVRERLQTEVSLADLTWLMSRTEAPPAAS